MPAQLHDGEPFRRHIQQIGVSSIHLNGRSNFVQSGLDALFEVHNEAELARVKAIGADIIGVNSRDLRTLQVDISTHARLAPQLPANALRVAESGISSGREINDLRKLGYQGFLVGESLMAADNPGGALAKLIAEAKASA